MPRPLSKAAKGGLAAVTAAILLLGGAGTLAYWSDAGTATGTGIASGHLKLVNDSCDGWKIDGGADYVSQLLVPGDTLTQVCSFTVDAAGDHLTASFDVSAPTFTTSNAFTSELAITPAYTVNGTPVSDTDVPIVDGDVIGATLTLDFDGPTATNASNDIGGFTSALEDVTITATSGHSA